MKNQSVADVMDCIADLLELKDENAFKIRAYRRAAQAIANFPMDLESLAWQDRLRDIPGVGEAIEEKIRELLRTGRLEYFEQLKQDFPPKLRDLMDVPGVGPKTAVRLWQELGIEDVEALEQAAEDGRIASLKGLGEKRAQALLRSLRELKTKDRRIPLGVAQPIVDRILDALDGTPGLRNLTPAGSLRRRQETIGDIDIIGTADDPERVMRAVRELPFVHQVLATGPTKTSVLVDGNLQVDVRLVPHHQFGSLLQHFTGDRQHNIVLRTWAEGRGLKLSEYGITDTKTGKQSTFDTEEAFYEFLGMQWMPPEIRDGTDEIELAIQHRVPTLVDLADIRGDLHVHTNWSDGSASIQDMARAAQARGYQYVCISDHSAGLGVAHGLTPDRLRQQIDAVAAARDEIKGIQILTSIEVDIRADGSIDCPDDLLARLDIVTASVHSSFGKDEAPQTERVLKAIRNPHVDVIGHLSGRLIGSRPPIQLDYARLFDACADTATALEINGGPLRLDLRDTLVRQAKQAGVRFMISSDAHAPDHLEWMRFGVGVARRGWCEAADVINAKSRKAFESWLHRYD